MDPDGEPIYVGRVHPKDKQVIDRITQSRNWDYRQFRQAVVALATVGQYIPAYNRPDSIHIQGLRPCIDELKAMTADKGKETARTVFADTQKKSLVVSGRTTVGSEHSVRLDVTPQKGRERYQKRALSVHVHPVGGVIGEGQGLSGQDYKTLLTDSEQQGMIMVFGDSVFIPMKTSVTPNNPNRESVERQVEEIKEDYLDNDKSRPHIDRLVAFNKAVCSEFGLTLYMATPETKDLANRVEVTK